MSAEAFISLGSNMGDRVAMIAAALTALDCVQGARVLRVSRAYESEPWGGVDQPPFANAVALVCFDGSADVLLAELADIEARLGRARGERYGPRPIDLDLLLFGDEEWERPDLTIPHPRMLERDFVVTPLLEIAPDAELPDGRPVASAADAVQGRVTGVLGTVPGFGASASAVERIGEWVAVGPPRSERGAGDHTDFALIMYEAYLKEAGIPVHFHPSRPNEGALVHPGIPATVRLMVPADRAEEARALITELADAEPAPDPTPGPEREK